MLLGGILDFCEDIDEITFQLRWDCSGIAGGLFKYISSYSDSEMTYSAGILENFGQMENTTD